MSDKKGKYQQLVDEIKTIEKQLSEKKMKAAELAEETYSVEAPENFEPQFREIQKKIAAYFSSLEFDNVTGEIKVRDERYLLNRSSSLSYDFFQGLMTLLDENTGDGTFELAYDLLFDIAHIIGKKDAEKYADELGLETPIDKLSAGPVHFAFTGWAKVEILQESTPSPDENFFLKYIHHNSFEADAWIKEKGGSEEAVCAMSAGYSSGWCAQSYGVELTAVEVKCSAKKSDDHCEFIMAHPSRIADYIEGYTKEGHSIPSFFERNFFKKQLADKKALIRSAEEFSKVGSITVNFVDDNAKWSVETYKIFEIDRRQKKDLFKAYLSRLDQATKEIMKDNIDRLRKEGESFEMKNLLHFEEEENKKWIVSSFSPLMDEQNTVIGMRGLIQDITHHMTGDRELDHFFKISADLLCIANHKGYFIKVSPAWTELLGYTEEELLSQPYVNFVHPDDRIKTYNEKNRLPGDFSPSVFENRYLTKSGEVVYLSWHSRVDELTKLIYSTARNVTNERKKEERLLSSLDEKELLLREIHHRVKNNLQVISSLLSLQSGMKTKTSNLEKLYEDSQNRIKSMAAIHEMFYKSESLDKINFPVYVRKLVIDLIYSLKGVENKIDLDFKSDDIRFDLDTAIPLGLIVNEIVTNALKHGLKDRKKGLITVSFKRIDDEHVELLIGDDGKGVSRNPLEQKDETLGIMLITNLVEQIGAEIDFIEDQEGTNFRIVIPQSVH